MSDEFNHGKYLQWQDALQHYKKLLDSVVKDAKSVNTNYQKYLQDNPFKDKRKLLAEKRKQYTKKILDLVEQGHTNYKL